MLKCFDCDCELMTIESDYGYEEGEALCVECYNERLDEFDDEPQTMREKYELAETQRAALMNKCNDLEKKYKRLHAKFLELREEYTDYKRKTRKETVQ